MAIRTILVPYDFSECATDALRVAAKLARLTGVHDGLHAGSHQAFLVRAPGW